MQAADEAVATSKLDLKTKAASTQNKPRAVRPLPLPHSSTFHPQPTLLLPTPPLSFSSRAAHLAAVFLCTLSLVLPPTKYFFTKRTETRCTRVSSPSASWLAWPPSAILRLVCSSDFFPHLRTVNTIHSGRHQHLHRCRFLPSWTQLHLHHLHHHRGHRLQLWPRCQRLPRQHYDCSGLDHRLPSHSHLVVHDRRRRELWCCQRLVCSKPGPSPVSVKQCRWLDRCIISVLGLQRRSSSHYPHGHRACNWRPNLSTIAC
jgi:hypothetical protein